MPENIPVDKVLDCKGLNCPLPMIKLKKAMSGLDSGQIIKMMVTDPGCPAEFMVFTKNTGNQIVKIIEEGNFFNIFIKKA